MNKIMLSLLLSAGIFSAHLSVAATGFREEEVNSANLTGSPYLVVTKDKTGNSGFDKEGIYTRSQSSKKDSGLWQLAIEGDVVGTNSGPLLDELTITTTSKNYESLALVNGKIVLFSINSNIKNSGSVIRFGSKDLPIFDIVSQRKLSIPPISSAEKVSIFQAPVHANDETQIVMISVQDEFSELEDAGFTFAVEVKASDDKGVVTIVGQPTMLAFNYYKTKQLRNFVKVQNGSTVGVFSPEILKRFAETSSDDPEALRKWKQGLSVLADSLGDTRVEELVKNAPFIELETGNIIYSNTGVRSEPVSLNGSTPVIQHNYINGKDTVTLRTANNDIVVVGNVNTDDQGNFKVWYEENELSALFLLNSQLYFVGRDSIGPFRISDKIGQYDKVSEISVVTSEFDKYEVVVTSAQISEDNAETNAYVVKKGENGEHYVVRSMRLSREYYSQSSLQQRLHSDAEGNVFFDHLTENVDVSSELYFQKYNSKGLHMHISVDGAHVSYLKPQFEKDFGSGVKYKEYTQGSESSDAESKTGLFIQDTNSNRGVTQVNGQLLMQPNTREHQWEQLNINKFKESKVFLVDASFQDGEAGFMIYNVLTDGKVASIHMLSVQEHVDNLYDVRIIRENNDSDNYFVLAIYKGEDDTTYAKGIAVDSKAGAILYEVETTLDHNNMDATEIDELLFYDEKGFLYILGNDHYGAEDEEYSLYSFSKNGYIYPNADASMAGKTFSSYKDVQEEKGNKLTKKGAVAYEWLLNKNRLKNSKAYKSFNERENKSVRTDLFPDLIAMLEEMADKTSENVHRVLVVPDEIKPHIQDIILHQWVRNSDVDSNFNIFNSKLDFYIFGETDVRSQDYFMKQLDVPQNSKTQKKALLFANAADIDKVGRVRGSNSEKSFKIEVDAENQDDSIFSEAEKLTSTPHAMYLMATEGKRVEPVKFSKKGVQPTYSQLILASESDWVKIKNNSQLEMSYGLDEHFDVVELGAPSLEEQIEMFKKYAMSSEVMRRGYRFDSGAKNADELTEEENIERLMKYLVTRVESLSRDQKKNQLIAFSEVLVKFKNALIHDKAVRKDKVVDRGMVERVLSRVFTLPLKLKFLPKDDPLVQLSQSDILLRIQNEGKYPGPFDVTKQVVDTILSQTRQETALKIPSTIILDGKSGTGKTQLALSLIKTLGLKTYNFNEAATSKNNMDAQAFVIHAPKLTSTETAAGLMNVDEALKHFEHFLTLPNGHRGFIVFDDLHLCSDDVRAKVISRIRTLIDSEDGMVHVKSAFAEEPKFESFPGRNLTIMMTYNPSEKEEDQRFTSRQNKEQRGIKALQGEKVKIDQSFFKRIGLYLIMDQFAIEAKGPALIERFKTQSKDLYQDGYFATLTKEVVDSIVHKFADSDARHFFSSAINGLTDLITEKANSSDYGVKIVVSKHYSDQLGHSLEGEQESATQAKGSGNQDVTMMEFIEENLVVLNVYRDNPESLLEFVNLVVNSYRNSIYNGMTKAILSNPRLSGNPDIEEAVQSNIMQGILDHLKTHPILTPLAMNYEPRDFAVKNPVEESNFKNSLFKLSGIKEGSEIPSYYPDIFSKPVSNDNLFEQVINNMSYQKNEKTRRDVNTDFVGRLKKDLNHFLLQKLNLNSFEELREIDGLEEEAEKWLMSIYDKSREESDEKVTSLDTGRLVVDSFIQYILDMESAQLLEKKSRQSVEQMSYYDKTRMFMYVLDKAISEMAWIESSRFLVFALREAVDNELGGSAVVQEFFYGNESVLLPQASDQTIQILLNSKARKSLNPQSVKEVGERFGNKCVDMLVDGGSN